MQIKIAFERIILCDDWLNSHIHSHTIALTAKRNDSEFTRSTGRTTAKKTNLMNKIFMCMAGFINRNTLLNKYCTRIGLDGVSFRFFFCCCSLNASRRNRRTCQSHPLWWSFAPIVSTTCLFFYIKQNIYRFQAMLNIVPLSVCSLESDEHFVKPQQMKRCISSWDIDKSGGSRAVGKGSLQFTKHALH